MKLFRRNPKPKKADPKGPLLATPLSGVSFNDHTEAQKGVHPPSTQLPLDSLHGIPTSSLPPITLSLPPITWSRPPTESPVPELAATQTSSVNEIRSPKPTISVNHWSLSLSPLRRASNDSMKAQYGNDSRAPETPSPSDSAQDLPPWAVITTPTNPANEIGDRGKAKSKFSVKHWPLPISSSSSQASSNASMRALVGDTRLPLPSSSSQASSNASMRVLVGDTRRPPPVFFSPASSNASMRVHLDGTWSEPGTPGGPGMQLPPEYVMGESFLRIQGTFSPSLTGSGWTRGDNENGVGDSMRSTNTERWASDIPGLSQPHSPADGQFAPGRGVSVEEEVGGGGPDDQMEGIPSLEILMTNHTPLNLSGQVTIPNRVNPAHGGLADVYAGLWDDRMVPPKQDDTRLLTSLKVAVKVLRIRKSRKADADLEPSNERRIAREMHVWAALKHPNISEFLGYSTDFGDYPSMISTWCKRGTASEYLDQQQRPVNERVRLAQDVSDGLEFLHLLKIVHGDLKPSNVLVDDVCVARLCDFGLVRLVDWEGPAGMTTTSPYMGTERYKAPELFISTDNRHPVATFEGDIYSLACIILEFIEQVYPFQRFRRNHELRNAIMDGYSPALRSEATDPLLGRTNTLWDLLEVCWDEPLRRPVVTAVVEVLGRL